jgi:hypothetical protein
MSEVDAAKPTVRQYVACKFRADDIRSYTYHFDHAVGDQVLQIGDEVKVADRSGDGWKRVIVAMINDTEPPFPTKPILGLAETKENEEDAI